MSEAFPVFPDLAGIQSERAFSMQQQNYLVAKCLLDECHSEAQRLLEGDYSAEQRDHMDRSAYAACLGGYLEQLDYYSHLDTFIEAKRQLLEWGMEYLRQGTQTPTAQAILTKSDLIQKMPSLQEKFLEICMRMEWKADLSE